MSAGQPKKFSSGEELIKLWIEFCEEIIDCGFETVPTQTAFCRWLGETYSDVDRKTIYNSLNKYFPTIKGTYEQIQSDVVSTGAMLGKYQSTMSIFALKNWCGWGDNGRRTEQEKADAESKLDRLIKAIEDV